MMSNPHLSVIIPAYNEEGRIGVTLTRVIQFLRTQKYPSEVIVVDDGSSDKTAELAEKTLTAIPHTVLKNEGNQGKGYSVKRGMLQAKGDFLLFSDADLSTPIEEVTRFLEDLKNGYDVVIGSRALRDSRIIEHQPFWREWMGRIFNLFARLFAFNGIIDSQCGFKAFKKDVGKDLFGRQKLKGFSFDAEIIYLAQREGYRILEEPVIWQNSKQTRVSVLKDPLLMFLDLMRIRWLHR